MNGIWTLLGLLLGLYGTAALAQQNADEHASHHPEQSTQGQQSATPTAAQSGSALSDLVQGMKKIQDLMTRIHETKDPAEKQALMNEHLRAMREEMRRLLAASKGMGMMSKDEGAGVGGGDGKGGMMSGDKEPPKDAGAAKQPQSAGATRPKQDMMGGDMMGKGMMQGGMMRMHKAMETRINVLTMMLEQMLEREAVEAGAEHDH
jgi:hypothetical protein